MITKYESICDQDDLLFFLITTTIICIILYCIYKVYTYYKVNITTRFLTDKRICNTRTPLYAHACENKKCPYKVKSEIISKISRARRTIDIAMFAFTNYDIGKAILDAHDRGVNIRIIVDKSMFNKDDSAKGIIKLLLSKGKILL